MKLVIAVLSIGLVALSIVVFNLNQTVNKINENTDLLRQYTDVSNDAVINREHKLQDKLEERITVLENQIDDLNLFIKLSVGKTAK